MLVTITNIGSDQIHLSAYGTVLDAGGSLQTRRVMTDIVGDESLKALVVAGSVSLAFAKEAGDDVVGGFGAAPAQYNDAGRPAATAVPAFTFIYNTDDAAPNWSDGTDWRDAAGVIT
jgi:hypothetical protein